MMDSLAFDPSTMTYLASQLAHPGAGGLSDPLQDMLLPMDLPEHGSAYGYGGSDHLSLHMHPHQHHSHHSHHPHDLKHHFSSYDDPFSDVVSALDHPLTSDPIAQHAVAPPAPASDPDAPSIERDHKLLSFGQPSLDHTLLDYTYRRASLALTAQLHGMFFLAESPWAAAAGDVQQPPSELTCYRRNLFQITGELQLPRALRYVVTDQGEHIPIIAQELVVSATESTEGNPVKIISVPWKTPATQPASATSTTSNPPPAEDKAEREPPSIPLDLMAGASAAQDGDGSDSASFPFQWKRLQFRIATANNGRRKELQQHFVVRLRVMATLATGAQLSIAEATSGPVIVRGRSPRNFQSRKDLPLNGSGSVRRASSNATANAAAERSGSQSGAAGAAGATNETSRRAAAVAALPELRTSLPPGPPGPLSAPVLPPSHSFFSPVTEHDFFDWPHVPTADTQQQQHATLAPKSVHSAYLGGNGSINGANNQANYPSTSPELARVSRSVPPAPAPINLSLVEEESPRSDGCATTPPDAPFLRPAKRRNTGSAGGMNAGTAKMSRSHSFGLAAVGSPDESVDLLYEYFPLGIDDWMPPVEAVYRPHVVHHTKIPYDSRDPRTGTKLVRSKRYFTEDVS